RAAFPGRHRRTERNRPGNSRPLRWTTAERHRPWIGQRVRGRSGDACRRCARNPVRFAAPQTRGDLMTAPRPYALLAELSYRCPLHCPYCSNPTHARNDGELTTDEWHRVLREATE